MAGIKRFHEKRSPSLSDAGVFLVKQEDESHLLRNSKLKPVVVIPAYQPGPELVGLVESLLQNHTQDIIVVDDGSSADRKLFFKTIASRSPRLTVLRHALNMGKGSALRTAFNHILLHADEDCVGVVTADADGQHRREDVENVSEALVMNPHDLCLGSRILNKGVPWRSRVGNAITRWIFRYFTGVSVWDTQTGLRGIPKEFLPELLRVRADGYDFELEMLLRVVRSGRRVREVPIQTIYVDRNAASHFRLLIDSIQVYLVFFRFSILSLVTAVLDFAVFSATYYFGGRLLWSAVTARLVAGLFNFTLSRALIFRSHGRILGEIGRYFSLVFGLLALSFTLMLGMRMAWGTNIYWAKITAEGVLFLASFSLQNTLVFRLRDRRTASAKGQTDWDSYYSKTVLTATWSRKVTERRLIALIQRYSLSGGPRHICELGGANSFIFDALRQIYPEAHYTVVDNNTTGLDRLRSRIQGMTRVTIVPGDVLRLDGLGCQGDMVFSVGLIEHFQPSDTARAIRAHFQCCRPGQIVLMTFPTPTLLYQFSRWCITMAGRWMFYDERPLMMSEVLGEARRYGEILHQSINWRIFLTQGIVVMRASRTPDLL
jgi:glycosyltransferase involved in cell wall biosynthesis